MKNISDKTLGEMITVARWIFAAAVCFLVIAHLYQFLTSREQDRSNNFALAFLHLFVFVYCCLLAAFAHLSLKRNLTRDNTRFRLALSCALWWTATATFTIFTSSTIPIFALIGFVFGIFTFFLWFEVAKRVWQRRVNFPRDRA